MSTPAPVAPDLLTIFDVEGSVEPHILRALKASGIFDAVPERSNADATTPRVDVQVHLGSVSQRNKLPAGATDRRQGLPSAWNVAVMFFVVTDRNVQAQQGAHGAYRARVRLLAAQFFTVLNSHIPYHAFQEMDEQGTTPNLTTADAQTEDVSKITFSGVVAVRPTAWPVGV